MFDIPEKYRLNKVLKPSTFVPKALPLAERKRLKTALVSINLAFQIVGEEIPSVMNDTTHTQAILVFEIELLALKDANFVANIIQSEIKEQCILRLYDKHNERYSYAIKRLNALDKTQVTIDATLLTPECRLLLSSDNQHELLVQLQFDNIVNKSDKVCFYNEMMTRACLVVNKGLFMKQNDALESKVWYNGDDVQRLFDNVVRLKELKARLAKTVLAKDKMGINAEIKGIIENIARMTD